MYLMLYNCIQFLDLKINMKLHMNFIQFHNIFLESWISGLKLGPSLLPVFRESQVTPKVRAETWQMQQQPALLREVQVEEVSPVDESMGTPLMKQHIADW